MASLQTTLSNFSFNGIEIEGAGQLNIAPKHPDTAIDMAYEVVEGIKTQQKVGFVDRIEKATKIDSGCAETSNVFNPSSSEKTWNPKQLEFATTLCYKDFESTFYGYLKRNGMDVVHIEETELYTFFLSLIQSGLYEDRLRIAEFGDTTLAAGDLTNGASDLVNYNMLDGIWKQYIGGANNLATTAFTAANGASTAAAQMAALGAGSDANGDISYGVLSKIYDESDARIFTGTEKFFVTRSVLNNYRRYLEKLGSEQANTITVNGMNTLGFRGVPIIPMLQWDRHIKDFSNGTVLDNPHRIALKSDGEALIGTDAVSAVDDLELWYDGKTKDITLRAMYKLDAKTRRDELISIAV